MQRDPVPAELAHTLSEHKEQMYSAFEKRMAKLREMRDQPHTQTGNTSHGPPADPIALASVQERLKRKFGLGDKPEARSKLYQRLESLASRYGQVVLDTISLAVAQSTSARQPARYFSALVKVLLLERGLWSVPGEAKAEVW